MKLYAFHAGNPFGVPPGAYSLDSESASDAIREKLANGLRRGTIVYLGAV